MALDHSPQLPVATPDQKWVVDFIEKALIEFRSNPQVARALQRLAREYPGFFFHAAARHVESEVESPAHRFLTTLLLRQDWLFDYLANPALCSCDSAVRLFKRFLAIDPTLDFKLARMLPGRNDSSPDRSLSSERAERAIEILDRTSPGQRLLSLLGHLPNSTDARIAAKATLFLGHRVHDPAWMAKQLNRDDDRLRANAVEAAWGAKSDGAMHIIEKCAEDTNNRVAGNALVYLHLSGFSDAVERTLAMSRAEEPGRRATAAWAMGRIGSCSFTGRLTELLRDGDPKVRSTAIRSLIEVGQSEGRRLKAKAASAEERVPEPTPEVVTPDSPEEKVPAMVFELRLDGSAGGSRRR